MRLSDYQKTEVRSSGGGRGEGEEGEMEGEGEEKGQRKGRGKSKRRGNKGREIAGLVLRLRWPRSI